MKNLTLEEMIDELVEFYECAGFEDYYERVLKNMDELAIRKHYEETFAEEDMILEAWEQKQEQGE
jgi:hypothetical protein